MAVILISAGIGILIFGIQTSTPDDESDDEPNGGTVDGTGESKPSQTEPKPHSSMIPGFIEIIFVIIVIGGLLYVFFSYILPSFSTAMNNIGDPQSATRKLVSWVLPVFYLLVAVFLLVWVWIKGVSYIRQTRKNLKKAEDKGLPDLISFGFAVAFYFHYRTTAFSAQNPVSDSLGNLDIGYLAPLLESIINILIIMILFSVCRVIISLFYPPEDKIPGKASIHEFWKDIKEIARLIINFAFETIEGALGSINLVPSLINSVCSLLGIPTSRNDVQKMGKKKKEQIYFLSALASVCFSVVSFLATKEGFEEYIYTNDSQKIFAILWTMAIQLMLLIFNLKLPLYLERRDFGTWRKRIFTVLAYVFLFAASSFMAFVHMTSAGYAKTRFPDANTLYESTYRKIAAEADAYCLEVKEQYQKDIIDKMGKLQETLNKQPVNVPEEDATTSGENAKSITKTGEIYNKYYDNYLTKLNKRELEKEYNKLVSVRNTVYEKMKNLSGVEHDRLAMLHKGILGNAINDIDDLLKYADSGDESIDISEETRTIINDFEELYAFDAKGDYTYWFSLFEDKDVQSVYNDNAQTIIKNMLHSKFDVVVIQSELDNITDSVTINSDIKLGDPEYTKKISALNDMYTTLRKYEELLKFSPEVTDTSETTDSSSDLTETLETQDSTSNLIDTTETQDSMSDLMNIPPIPDSTIESQKAWDDAWADCFQKLKAYIQSLPLPSDMEELSDPSIKFIEGREEKVKDIDKKLYKNQSTVNPMVYALYRLGNDHSSNGIAWVMLIAAFIEDAIPLFVGIALYFQKVNEKDDEDDKNKDESEDAQEKSAVSQVGNAEPANSAE